MNLIKTRDTLESLRMGVSEVAGRSLAVVAKVMIEMIEMSRIVNLRSIV